MATRQVKASALDKYRADASLLDTLRPEDAERQRRKRDEVPDEKYRGTFIIGRSLSERLAEIARAEQVAPSDVVRFLLRKLDDDYAADGPLTQEMRSRVYEAAVYRRIR